LKKPLNKRLIEALPGAAALGREVIPAAISRMDVQTYLFDAYWEDIGTIAAFSRANMEMTLPLPPFNFFDTESPIYTRPRYLPGSKLLDCHIESSIITEGCIINGATVTDSIIGIRSRIEHGTRLQGVLMMGSDFYQNLDELQRDESRGYPRVGVGRNCSVRRAIIDKNARIGSGVQILNQGCVKNFDGEQYFIRDGIVIVPKNSVIEDGVAI